MKIVPAEDAVFYHNWLPLPGGLPTNRNAPEEHMRGLQQAYWWRRWWHWWRCVDDIDDVDDDIDDVDDVNDVDDVDDDIDDDNRTKSVKYSGFV